MGFNSPWHWLVVLLIILLLFGAKRIPDLAKGMGSAIKNFKKEMNDDGDAKEAQQNPGIANTTNTTDNKIKDGEKV